MVTSEKNKLVLGVPGDLRNAIASYAKSLDLFSEKSTEEKLGKLELECDGVVSCTEVVPHTKSKI